MTEPVDLIAGATAPPPPRSDAEAAAQNETLRKENEALRMEISTFKVQLQELSAVKGQLRAGNATIVRQHDELLQLRKRCAAYRAAIEQTKANYAEMKELFAALSPALTSSS
jgi:predicted nuclease with TOPRIM domain